MFDTPATALQWVLPVAWAAGQETLARSTVAPPAQPENRRWRALSGARESRVPPALRGVAARSAAVALASLVLVAAIYSMTYRPFDAARTFATALYAPIGLDERLDLARQSFDVFPAMASATRLRMFLTVDDMWDGMSA